MLGLATGLAILAKLKRPEVISVGVECSYQNVGIATSAAVAMFDDHIERGQALCVPLFYGTVEAIVLAIYCVVGWKLGWSKAPKDEKVCTMLFTTYEIDDDSEHDEANVNESNKDESERSERSEADLEGMSDPLIGSATYS